MNFITGLHTNEKVAEKTRLSKERYEENQRRMMLIGEMITAGNSVTNIAKHFALSVAQVQSICSRARKIHGPKVIPYLPANK